MMKVINQAQFSFPAQSVNEGFARAAVAAFLAQADPTVADLTEMKTAVSGYLQTLYDLKPDAVGGAMPGDGFYWLGA